VDRAHWHHEAQAVGGGEFAAAPLLGERDACLVVDEPGVGRGDCVGAQVVCLDPLQARLGEGWDVAARHGGVRDVATLNQEGGADRERQIGRSGGSGRWQERLGEAGPRVDFEQHLGQFRGGDQGGDSIAQQLCADRQRLRVERRNLEAFVGPVGGEQAGFVGDDLTGVGVGVVEFTAEPGEQPARPAVEVEGPFHAGAVAFHEVLSSSSRRGSPQRSASGTNTSRRLIASRSASSVHRV